MSWQRQNTDAANEVENEQLAGIYSKFEIYCVRLSLILELMSWAAGENATNANNAITQQSVEGAIQLISYFQATARRVHSILSQNPVEGLDKRRRDFYKTIPATFTTDKGLAIAETMDFPERTYKRFLNEVTFFERLEHGRYRKKF